MCWSLFFDKVVKKETPTQVFSCEFLRTPFFTEHLRWLLLYPINLIEAHRNRSIFVSCFLNFV